VPESTSGQPQPEAQWVKVEFHGWVPSGQVVTGVDLVKVGGTLMRAFGFTAIDGLTVIASPLARPADAGLATGSLPHQPQRGGDVEAWIKQRRDEYRPSSTDWTALDRLLDDYRLHADTGTPLSGEVI
jgi:hypothetical protein